jgi:hypothetical protein
MDKYNELWDKVYECLWNHKGSDSVNIRVIKENKLKTLTKKELGVAADENIIPEIEAILGANSVVIR